jgi:hypothetical protein
MSICGSGVTCEVALHDVLGGLPAEPEQLRIESRKTFTPHMWTKFLAAMLVGNLCSNNAPA